MATPQTLLVILGLAGLGSAALVALSASALLRRRSWSYFLVTLAIGSLLLRTFLGAAVMGGYLPISLHHVLEHLLDGLIVGLLFAAVYVARSVDPDPPLRETRQSTDRR